MKLFLINLDRRPDRLRRMTEILDGLDLPFTRIPAVDGMQLSMGEVQRWGSLPPGATACFLSHRDCWKRVVDEALPHAVVLEDDLHLAPDAASLLCRGDWVPTEADVVKLETRLCRTRVDKGVAAVISGRSLHRLRSSHMGTGGYIVARKGAERLLALSERLEVPVDHFMFNSGLSSATSLTTFQLVPAVCVQDSYIGRPSMVLGIESDLLDERPPVKPRGIRKFWRELKRPFLQFSGFVQRGASVLLTDKKWVFVKFA
ncbi:glycosyltransferase family 25 protein [Chelativorans sp. AA-79]|uniref:glycosyltransferase family 25 protein n=1 Tax=Chelativorans sp. AA-79 TaxID=3028735 RepID=UPI0023F867AD|nr:glycosyltransferase family 25 protein [Chelativorans sp. AA-79]WEX11191.1 glycosyltransferase family 25 protein [Chelativorans sp. AA-79]